MRISLERTGGFGGMRFKAAVDTSEVPADERGAIEGLVEGAGFFDLPERIGIPSAQADRQQYLVTVEAADRTKTVAVSEEAMSPELRTLVERVTHSSSKG